METKPNQITEAELAQINKYTRRALTAQEVYAFSVVLCDNEIDRDLERFDSEALPILAEMFTGKTGIFDHCASAKNQRARIFAAECVTDEGRKTQAGEDYRCISAKAYIPRTQANAALIEEIESGIKKEVSVGCAMARVTCSVCGEELRKSACAHKRGRIYGGQVCHAVLREPTDAYEWSFVAVPAQVCAGVSKEESGGRFTVNKKSGSYYESELTPPLRGTPLPEGGESGASSIEKAEERQTAIKPESEAASVLTAVKEETLKLAMAVMPALEEETARSLCAQLSFGQCRDFADALREKQTLAKPRTPQLAVKRGNAGEMNAAFKI